MGVTIGDLRKEIVFAIVGAVVLAAISIALRLLGNWLRQSAEASEPQVAQGTTRRAYRGASKLSRVASAVSATFAGVVLIGVGLVFLIPDSTQGSDADDRLLSVSPVNITLLEGDGVDVSWSVSHAAELHGYTVLVSAVRPISYEFAVPRYPGDSDVTERIYPTEYLNAALEEEGDTARVAPGQIWHVCVQGMADNPVNTAIDDYIIPGTRACSEDFVLP